MTFVDEDGVPRLIQRVSHASGAQASVVKLFTGDWFIVSWDHVPRNGTLWFSATEYSWSLRVPTLEILEAYIRDWYTHKGSQPR